MKRTIGILKSPHQFTQLSFSSDSETPESQVHDIDDLARAEIDACFYPKSTLNEQGPVILGELVKSIPVRSLEEVGLANLDDKKLTLESMQNALDKAYGPWTLHNNISLIDELFNVIPHLNQLWPNERTTFFEELWHLLKLNLGTTELKIIFNTIQTAEKETQKDKLSRAMISGTRKGQPLEGGDVENQIMEHYSQEFHKIFDIIDYNQDKGELVAAATIKKSPVLIMAKLPHLTKLQQAVTKSLFEGLSCESL
jgi:hypothetical protein